MATATHVTVAGTFETRLQAIRAVEDLQRAGFDKDQIGIVGQEVEHTPYNSHIGETEAEEGALAGTVAGAGLGALVGWGVLTGMIPVVGQAIAAGTLGVILSNAAAGAAVAGLTGTLIGWGIPATDATHYETELRAGRTLVTVHAGDRAPEAAQILDANGARVRPAF